MKLLWSVILVLFPGISFAEQYLCVADKSTGFYYNKMTNSWDHAILSVKKSRYIISSTKDDKYAYHVKKYGMNVSVATCDKGFSKGGILLCGGLTDFRFNKTNGRFIHGSVFGYVYVMPEYNKITDETSDKPYVEIGKCSPVKLEDFKNRDIPLKLNKDTEVPISLH